MLTVWLLHREEGMVFRSSGAALLNEISPKVTRFTFSTMRKVLLSLQDL